MVLTNRNKRCEYGGRLFGNVSNSLKTDSLCTKILTLYSPFTKGPILFYYILIFSKRQPKKRGLSVRYGKWSFTRIEPHGVSSKMSSGHV